MATRKKGNGPAPLDPKVVKKLLDLLSTDNEFRRLFKKDAHAALLKAGHKPPVALKSAAATTSATSAGACLQMTAGSRIATKSQITRDRQKLEQVLGVPFSFMCPVQAIDN